MAKICNIYANVRAEHRWAKNRAGLLGLSQIKDKGIYFRFYSAYSRFTVISREVVEQRL